MTKVIFRQHPESEAIEMRVQGHVGLDVDGKDLVCAGASTLALTAAQNILSMRGQMQKEPTVVINSGCVRIVAKPKPEHYGAVLLVFAVIQTGFRILADAFPDNITINTFMRPERADIKDSSPSRTD